MANSEFQVSCIIGGLRRLCAAPLLSDAGSVKYTVDTTAADDSVRTHQTKRIPDMIVIDARDAVSPRTRRPFTVIGAVEIFADGLGVGDWVRVGALLNEMGEERSIEHLRTSLAAVAGKRKFRVRAGKEPGVMAIVYRMMVPETGN